jgi:hypothetical protein
MSEINIMRFELDAQAKFLLLLVATVLFLIWLQMRNSNGRAAAAVGAMSVQRKPQSKTGFTARPFSTA